MVSLLPLEGPNFSGCVAFLFLERTHPFLAEPFWPPAHSWSLPVPVVALTDVALVSALGCGLVAVRVHPLLAVWSASWESVKGASAAGGQVMGRRCF